MQYNEDIILKLHCQMFTQKYMNTKKIHELLGSKPIGFYIDIGAFDGLKANNTKYFEDIGWQGIAVEPHPTSFSKLESNRTCAKENIIITDHDGESEFHWSDSAPMTSRVDMSGHRNRIHRMSDVIKTTIPCMTVTSLCEKYSVGHVDFLKIDAEGHDWAVINGIDFSKISISFIVFEMWENHNKKEYNLSIEKLVNAGFTDITNDYDHENNQLHNKYYIKNEIKKQYVSTNVVH